MPPSPLYRPEPVFQSWGAEFADPVAPAAFPETILRFRNARAAASVGLETLSEDEWLAHFARFEPLPGNQRQPLAMRYHGHQFRVYNPDLGDGRGFLFAQLREVGGAERLLDLATKGSGRTPWSRDGDGRLTLKGGAREVLAAAMLEALGVPTSRAFSLVETGEALIRNDEPSPTRSAVLTRLSFSHIRFGSFQRHAAMERPDLVRSLVEKTLATYFPARAGAADAPSALLEVAVRGSAELAARWMAAGFVHGVLNTDNMVVTGESFDYGPWRFLPRNDPNFTAAYFDHAGLYAFGRQPEAAYWNLQQLALALATVGEAVVLAEALNRFPNLYRDALRRAMLRRLGVAARRPEVDVDLANAAFRALAAGAEALRWEPFFFDWFGGGSERALAGPRAALYGAEGFADFRRLIAEYGPVRPDLLASPYFAAAEPEELLYEAIEALWAAIAERDDWGPFNAKLERIEAARQAWGLAAEPLDSVPGSRLSPG